MAKQDRLGESVCMCVSLCIDVATVSAITETRRKSAKKEIG